MRTRLQLALVVMMASGAALAQVVTPPVSDSPVMQRGIDQMMQMDAQTIQAAMGMGACVQQKIGMNTMQRIAEDAQAFEKKMLRLCKADKRDEAAELQQRFAARMQRTGDYQKLEACYDQYKTHLKDPALDSMHRRVRSFEGEAHVCDS